jgi:ABC-2 type transport system ATP-binding protein
MTTDTLEAQAQTLRDRIADDPAASLDRLVKFVSTNAINADLPIDAVMLKMMARQNPSARETDKLREDMLKLLFEVIEDQSSATEEERQLRSRREQVRREFAGRDLDPRVVVECRGLGKSFSDFRLRGVDLKLRLGQITGVVGENANGKTTLFRLLVGEVKQSEGMLCYPELGAVEGKKIDWSTVRRSIAYVPQILKPWHGSLEDNLRFAASSHGIRGKDNDREFLYITERLALTEYLNRSWDELSGGYRLRFELARALIWKPKLLALDEPLANLDFKAQLTLLRDIRNLARSYTAPMAVVISSQHLHEVEAVADDILFLRRGNVVFNGPLKDVGHDRHINTYEINCEAALDTVKQAIDGPEILKVTFNGLSIVIETKVDLTREDLLQRLISGDLGLTYFRDLSNSVKQLFEQTVVGT